MVVPGYYMTSVHDWAAVRISRELADSMIAHGVARGFNSLASQPSRNRSTCDCSDPHGDRRRVDPIPAWSDNGAPGAPGALGTGRSGGFLSTQNIRRCYNFPGPLLIPIPRYPIACISHARGSDSSVPQTPRPSNLPMGRLRSATNMGRGGIPACREVRACRSILPSINASAERTKRNTRRELPIQAPCTGGDLILSRNLWWAVVDTSTPTQLGESQAKPGRQHFEPSGEFFQKLSCVGSA